MDPYEHLQSPPKPTKRRRLYDDHDGALAPCPATIYTGNLAEGSSRNQYGNILQTYNAPVYHQSDALPQAHPVNGAEDKNARLAIAIEALRFDEMRDRYDTIERVYSGTCRWFFEGDEYRVWRSQSSLHQHHGFFWIRGKPGAGKSTLMKDAYLHGAETFGREEDHALASFFFDARAGDSELLLQKSIRGLFRSLLHQVLVSHQDVATRLGSHRLERLQQQDWPTNLLKGAFQDAVLALGSSQLTCYVDALDECNESEARDLVQFFEDLGSSAFAKDVRFRVLFSSRHYPHMDIGRCQHLVLEHQTGHSRDIERYIRRKLHIKDSKRARRFRAALQEKSDGVFLWIALVIPLLNKDYSRGDFDSLEQRLRETPGDLHELFANLLSRDSHNRQTLLLTLQWLMFARRPLRREELYFAVWHDSRAYDVQAWDRNEVTLSDMGRYLLNASKGLTELSKGKRPTVRFIHESVRDYLRKSGFKWLDPQLTMNLDGHCHDRLKQCCQGYLSKCVPTLLPLPTDGTKESLRTTDSENKRLQDETLQSHPFLHYALAGILYHANSAHAEGLQQDGFVADFPLKLWCRFHNLLARYQVRRLNTTVSAAYLFAINDAHNLLEIATRDVDAEPDWNRPLPDEQYKSLLGAVLERDCPETLRTLLNRGASPEFRVNYSSQCSLRLAILQQKSCMVKLLLDAGARPGGDDLRLVAVSEKLDMTKLLVDAGAKFSSDDLSVVVKSGNPDMARLLLDSGVEVSRHDVKNAIQSGDINMAKILLDADASPLTTALRCRNLDMYQYVLSQGKYAVEWHLHFSITLALDPHLKYDTIERALLERLDSIELDDQCIKPCPGRLCDAPDPRTLASAFYTACQNGRVNLASQMARHFNQNHARELLEADSWPIDHTRKLCDCHSFAKDLHWSQQIIAASIAIASWHGQHQMVKLGVDELSASNSDLPCFFDQCYMAAESKGHDKVTGVLADWGAKTGILMPEAGE